MQGVQSLLPQRPVAAKPLIYFCERCGAETVDPPLRLLAGLDQPRFPLNTRRWRETPGRAIGSNAASSPAVAGPWASVSSSVLRLSSVTAGEQTLHATKRTKTVT